MDRHLSDVDNEEVELWTPQPVETKHQTNGIIYTLDFVNAPLAQRRCLSHCRTRAYFYANREDKPVLIRLSSPTPSAPSLFFFSFQSSASNWSRHRNTQSLRSQGEIGTAATGCRWLIAASLLQLQTQQDAALAVNIRLSTTPPLPTWHFLLAVLLLTLHPFTPFLLSV